jgi:hypothetical protein
MNRLAREVLAIAVSVMTAILAIVGCTLAALPFIIFGPPLEAAPRIFAFATTIGLLMAFVLMLRLLRRSMALPPVNLSSRANFTIVALYLVTWIFGAPQVHSDLASEEIAQYKTLLQRADSGVTGRHPYIASLAAFPVAPGLLLTYHEFQLAGLHGEGAWLLHVWYFTGTRKLLGFPVWMS